MSIKVTVSAASLVLGSLSFPVYSKNQSVESQISSLQKQINSLKTQLKHQKNYQKKQGKKKIQDVNNTGNNGYNPSRISMGPYLNKDRLYDGSELIINQPSVREQAALLKQAAQLATECAVLGIPTPEYPRLEFSGKLEGLFSYSNPYIGNPSANINFSGAELDTLIQASSFITGYLALDYDPSEAKNGSRIYMNRAFITIGNLAKSPFYTTIGQIYTSFGRYSSAMVTSPSTLALGRTRARALEVGFQQMGNNALHAELYTYQGLTSPIGSTNTNNQWGSDIGYAFNLGKVTGEVGGGYISNLGDSQGVQAALFSSQEIQQHNVPGVDAYASLSIRPVVFIAEYVQALNSFALNEASFANHGAKPAAFHTEADYTFKTGSKPSSIGVGYDHTAQGLALGLPQQSAEIFYNVNIFRNTNFAIEYRHDINYSLVDKTTNPINPTPVATVQTLGKSDHMISAQFDLYF